jgi:hypothetical protein
VQSKSRTDQLLENLENGRAAHDPVKDRMHLVRRLDPANPWIFRGVAGLEIVDLGVIERIDRSSNKLRDHLAYLGNSVGGQDVGHEDKSVALVGLHILLRNHLECFSLASVLPAPLVFRAFLLFLIP